MKLKINNSVIVRNLFICVGLLLIGHALAVFLLIQFPESKVEGSFYNKLISLFNFNLEANLPTYFSALLLLGNAFLLSLIAFGKKQQEGNNDWHWIGMALVFCLLSFDEMIKIHEHLTIPTENLLETSGYFRYAWLVPYGILIFILGLVYIKFLLKLPKRILWLFTLAAVLFISGAFVLEAISAKHDENYGQENLGYYLMYTFEELMEMSGSIVFFYALLSYISLTFGKTSFKFQPKKNKLVNS